MSTSALLSALSGLRVNQASLDVTANNISNATTTGYTRKTLPQETIVAGTEVIGVQIGEVRRHVDEYVMRDYRTQVSLQSKLNTTESYLERIVSYHGRPEQENNLAAKIGQLRNIFNDLAAVPESKVLQTEVVDVAQNLAESFNSYANLMLEQRNQTQTDIDQTVDVLNARLEEIASLNKRIQAARTMEKSTATLEDQRDIAVEDIGKMMDITYFTDGSGALVVQSNIGQVLVDSEARHLSFDPNRLGFQSAYPGSAPALILHDGQNSYDLTEQEIGGSLGALLELRDETLPSYQAQLDELAHKMALRFEAQNLRLFTDKSGVIPNDIPEQYAGFSSEIQVNPIVDNNPSLIQAGTSGATPDEGDNAIIMDVLQFAFGRYQDAAGTPHPDFRVNNIGPNNQVSINVIFQNTTLEDFAQSMISRQAEDHSQVEERLATEKIYTNDIQRRLLNESAVDTDEEMALLIQLQQNYAAAARMIAALDKLFDELINSVR